jgi:hypothetical protein
MESIRAFSVVLGMVLDAQMRIHAHESAMTTRDPNWHARAESTSVARQGGGIAIIALLRLSVTGCIVIWPRRVHRHRRWGWSRHSSSLATCDIMRSLTAFGARWFPDTPSTPPGIHCQNLQAGRGPRTTSTASVSGTHNASASRRIVISGSRGYEPRTAVMPWYRTVSTVMRSLCAATP